MSASTAVVPVARVLTVAHDIADARLQRLCRSLLDAGFRVEVAALGSLDHAPAGVDATVRPRAGAAARLRNALGVMRRSTADITVVLDPDLAIFSAVARRLRRMRCLVVDVHEDYRAVVNDRAMPGWMRPIVRALAAVADRAARSADWTVVADHHLSPLVAPRRRVVRNTPVPTSFAADPDTLTLRAVYVGDVRRSRGALAMAEAVERVAPWQLDVIGPVNDVVDRTELTAIASRCDRIRLHGRLPPGESWRRAEGADVGLCLLEPTPAFVGAMPTKIYEYLDHGMAVITTDLPRPADLVETADAGVVVADSTEAAATLRRWRDAPDELRRHRHQALVWSRRNAPGTDPFSPFAHELRRALHPSGVLDDQHRKARRGSGRGRRRRAGARVRFARTGW